MATIRKRTCTTATGQSCQAFAVHYPDNDGNRQRKQFTKRGDADAFRIEIEGQIQNGTFRPDAQKITVEQVATEYLAYVRGRMERKEQFSRRHLAMVEGRVWNYICPDPKRSET